MLKPSNFTTKPWGCVFQKSEAETIATNIMVILKRTGDEWRELTFEEYKTERLKDGNFSEWKEKNYFEQVYPYCQSPETAATFSPSWAEIKE